MLIKSCSIDYRNEQSPTCEVVHETKLTSEISFPTDSLLAQLAEHGTDDLEVVDSIPGKDNFFYIALFLQCWQDPATMWQEISNYVKTRITPRTVNLGSRSNMQAWAHRKLGRIASLGASDTWSHDSFVFFTDFHSSFAFFPPHKSKIEVFYTE